MLGLLAVGDSITTGQSWAVWLADSMDVPLRRLARDGATAADAAQLVRATIDGHFTVGAVLIGANDVVRATPIDDVRAAVAEIIAATAGACETVAVLTLPSGLAAVPLMPRLSAARRRGVEAINGVLVALAVEHRAIVVPLEGLAGPVLMAGDRLHPTPAGQVWIADAVARAIGLSPPPRVEHRRGVTDRAAHAAGAARWTARHVLRRT